MFDTLLHRWLHIPYALHTTVWQSPPKSRATVLFIHGIGNSGEAWKEVVQKLPADLHLVTIDLLGFGKSPRPKWAVYNTATQARSLVSTLIKLRLKGPVILVGHSLGALVAVEVTKRYPLLVSSLVLCSPPFYKPDEQITGRLPRADKILKRMFKYTAKHPEQALKAAQFALRYGLVTATFELNNENVDVYMAALESSIINQTSLEDAKAIKKPMLILVGQFDPVVVRGNIKELTAENPNAHLRTVLAAGHDVRGKLVPAVAQAIAAQIDR